MPRALSLALKWPPTRWDARLFTRALGLAFALAAVALAISTATDEITSTWGDRAMRLAVFCPVLGSVAFLLARSQASRRGEITALASSGVGPVRALGGALSAAILFGLTGALCIWALRIPLDALFPAFRPSPWARTAHGFNALQPGIVWDLSNDRLRFIDPSPSRGIAPARGWVGLAIAVYAFLLPYWAALPQRSGPRLTLVFMLAVAVLVAFHAVAVGAHPALLLAPALAHGAYVARLARRAFVGHHARGAQAARLTEKPRLPPSGRCPPVGARARRPKV